MKTRNAVYRGLGILQLLIAISAVSAGAMMLSDPSGSSIGLSLELISGSPFKTYFIPASILFIVIGLAGAIGSILSFRRNLLAGQAAIGLGIILIGWLGFQIYWIGFFPFQQLPIMFFAFSEIAFGYYLHKKSTYKQLKL